MNNCKNLIKQFEIETKLSNLKRVKLLKYFSKLPVPDQIEVLKEQKKQYYKLKSSHKESFTLSLSSLILAIDKVYQLDMQGLTKNRSYNIKNIKDKSVSIVQNNRKLRLKVKREKILNLWSVIEELKTANYSYREMSDYLKRRHKFEVSHTFIHNIWKEIENDNY